MVEDMLLLLLLIVKSFLEAGISTMTRSRRFSSSSRVPRQPITSLISTQMTGSCQSN